MNKYTFKLLFAATTLAASIFVGDSLVQAASKLPAAKVSKPNILYIMSDDHAKNAISCYGNKDIQTPGLDRLAREGMRFEHALTPNSFCTPSRAVVLTGKYSHKNGVTHLNQKFDGSQQTFPKLLQKVGYETALFGKWHLVSQPTGFDFYCVQKMQGMPYNPIVFETGMPWIPWSLKDRVSYRQGGRKLKGYNNDVITDEALNWLKSKRNSNKPFCLLLHPKPPHQPYVPPVKYEDFLKDIAIPEPATLLDDYKGRTPEAIQDIMSSNRIVLGQAFQEFRKELEKENPEITRDELTRKMYQEYIKGYYRLVKSVDDNVGRMLDYLKESGLEENTLVIYTSDQGFSLGEHGFYNKQWMYEGPLHQPLIVRYPKVIKAGTVHNSMVNHVDIAPTLLDFAGVSIPDDMQGYSLKPILKGDAEKVRDASYYHFYEHGKGLPEMIGVRTATHKLIHYPEMKEKYQWELFDLKKDPDEMENLYRNPKHKDIMERMKKKLKGLISTLDDPVEAPNLMKDRGGKRNGTQLEGHNEGKD
jgi:arylsulfatase A-like enzyme